ncbi:YSIRK-type signal peptide-containing protein, partial [Streptococcus pseudopneumoniae]|uniref:YSIRK-type signal peptide-containing protein n=1 Tax=Streptococcus pseudopneumoniae TaxID=257758 RepID=UPI0018B02A48
MEDKSNSLSRVKRHQREKVLRFSIRKYSFGAASVAVAALMFMGANVVSADSPSQNTSSSTTGLASPKDGEQSSEAGQARNENQAEVASEPSANNEAQPAEEKAATVDNSRLSKLVEEVSALLSTDSKHDPSVVSPIKERLQKGKELLARADADQGELDSLAEKLEKDLAVLSSSSKEESQPQGSESADKNASSERSDHKEEGSDRAASASGAEDKPKRSRRSRRDLSARSAADNTDVEGALLRPKGYISEERSVGGTEVGNKSRTIEKTFMRSRYSVEGGKKFLTYDVYFQNNGHALPGLTRQALWFYPPRDLLYSDGSYPKGPIYEAYYERYKKNTPGETLLSHNPSAFVKNGETYHVPLNNGKYEDDGGTKAWGTSYSHYQLTAGPNRDSQRQGMLKNLEHDSELNSIIKQGRDYPKLSYSHLLSISHGENYAYKYHVKLRLKDDVTEEQASRAGSMAVTTSSEIASNAKAAYVYAAAGTRLVSRTDAETYPIQGSSHTKTVGEGLSNTDNPVGDGYITLKNGGEFPGGMAWSWQGNRKPSTAQAGVFTYKVIAEYGDGSSSENANSGSDGTVKLTVKPKKPTISDFENKKGLTGQKLTVNVGAGVKNGSIVKLYDGTKVIGEGITKGQTAVVTVKDALPGRPITAETIVNNDGEVKSERSDAVTPTPQPDNQPPTLTVTPERQTVKIGENIRITLDAQDDTKVKLNVEDLLNKYPNHLAQTSNPNREVDTDTHKKYIFDLGAATTADLGEKTITFKVTDDAGHTTSKQVTVKVVPATPETETPVEIEITRKDNGDAVVTPKKRGGGRYPKGTKVLIPGENNTPIEVTIGDNGSGEIANDKLPKGAMPGKGTVTEPKKKASQPVDVTTPARKTPTVELSQDPTTGDVTVTPKKPDGSTYPEGTIVELPGKDGRPIKVTIGADGSAKVPNDQLPDTTVVGNAKITEPGKAAVEVPNVTTPAKVTPATPETEKPGKIEITQQPNGNAIVTPKKPDGSTYPRGTKVEIPGENGTTITVTIGDNGSGEIANDKLPKGAVPGTGTVTEP